MKRRWRQNIKMQLYLFLFFLVVVAICSLSLVTYWKSVQEQKRKFSESNRQILNQLSDNLNGYFDDLLRLSFVPVYSRAFVTMLEQDNADTTLEELERQRDIEEFLDTIMVYPRKDILNVFLIADRIYYGSRYRPSFYNSTSIADMDAQVLEKLSKKGAAFFQGPYQSVMSGNSGGEIVSVLNSIYSTGPEQKLLAVIKVDANFATIQQTCADISIGEHSGLVLLNSDGSQAYASIPAAAAEQLVQQAKDINAETTLWLGGEQYLVNSAEIEKSGWRIFALTSFADINADAADTRNLMLVSAVILAALAILTLVIFLQRFLAPLYEIMNRVTEVGKGNFHIQFPAMRGDEIGMLGRSMNEVVSRLDSIVTENAALQNRVLQAQLIEKEAQLNMLYSQIQPHFIYNTLNMISMSVQMGRTEEAVTLLYKLSKLMRSMSKSDSLHSLDAELQLLTDYLDIQKIRYGTRLSYVIVNNAQVRAIPVPTMLLQPIVENAIVHGCESKRKCMTIEITVEAIASDIQLTISDNGPGIDLDTLAYLCDTMNQSATENSQEAFGRGGVGLRNVNRRLKIRYGESYGLSVESCYGEGTCVKLRIPLLSPHTGERDDQGDKDV